MKVALYARVSSDKQDIDLSISAQLKALRDYAARNGHEIVREYVDEAESGRTTDRPAFMEMIAGAKRRDRPFDLILVYKYSRFARNREDSIVFKAMLRKNGVQVVSITEPTDDSPAGRLFEAMVEALDEFYSANLGEEVTRGTMESASRGFWVNPRTPYGYRRVRVSDGGRVRVKLEIDPAAAGVVRRLYDSVLAGRSLLEIARELNREGIAAPRGRKWGKTSVRQVLQNEACTGTLVWGRNSIRKIRTVRVENAFPAIVSREVFGAVQKKLAERAFRAIHPRRAASRYLLSGIVRCGHCGKSMVGQDAKGGRYMYYVCGSLLKRGAGVCPARYLPAEKFERLVIDRISEHILTEENLKEMVRLVNEEMDAAIGEYGERLETINIELEDVRSRLDRLYDALETGRLTINDLGPRIQELRERQKQLQAAKWETEALLADRRVALADEETVRKYLDDLHTLLAESTLIERRSVINSFVKEIKVTGDRVILTYTMPLPPKGTAEEEIGVLPIVQYGGPWGTVPELLFEKKGLIPAVQQLLVSRHSQSM